MFDTASVSFVWASRITPGLFEFRNRKLEVVNVFVFKTFLQLN